ncbi:MAG: hypothetical protein WKF96_07775 [Solirubrobacteraceae bacterium]
MSARTAPASIFRASAIAATDVPWVEDGFHLRVKLNPWIGFPLHPFAAWRMEYVGGQPSEVDITWTDREGTSYPIPFDLEEAAGEAIGTVKNSTAKDPWIWIELEIDDRGVRVDLLDARYSAGGATRVLATRRGAPFRFGNTEITHLRASGHGAILRAHGVRLSDLAIEEYVNRPPDFTFGLPLEDGPWYAPDPASDPRGAAAERVRAAASRRLSPPDNPAGDLPDDTDPSTESDRIIEVVAPKLIEPWLTDGFGDPQVAPADAIRAETGATVDGSTVRTSAPVTPSLLTMAVDPQIARHLGLATMIPFGETAAMQPANVWLIASRWAVQGGRPVLRLADGQGGASVPLSAFLESAATVSGIIDDRLDEAFSDAADILAGVPDLPHRDDDGPWSVVTLFAVAVAAGEAPPDAPDPFTLSLAEPGAWNAHADAADPGPERWRQPISLGDEPARGMVGFARMAPGTPIALHRCEPPPGEGFVSRVLPLVPNWASNNRRTVTDRELPPDPDGASWQVWQADEFGQWSEGAQLNAPLPARPAPPPPVAEVTYVAAADDGSSGPRVPGTLHLRYVVPDGAHGAPGSLPVVRLSIFVDGQALAPIVVTPGQTVQLDAGPASFGVGEQRAVPIVSSYLDSEDRESEPEALACQAFDARPPRPITTSPVVLWTGQPDATGQAELSLRWPPRAGAARYRVYLGDARRLADSLGILLPAGALRAAQAKPIHDASAAVTDRQSFTFLGETLATTGGDGLVHFGTTIPGSLRGIQFVRIVPLTAGGAEAPFQDCGLVPVAVPSVERPPIPLLDATTDPAAGLTLLIRARGLRAELLAAAAGGAPEYRLRRTRTGGQQRMHVPVWRTGSLRGPAADGSWTATVTLPATELEPFVRTTWFAEVRYPAEPPVPPGAAAESVDGAVQPDWSAPGSSVEGLWSPPSLPAASLIVPSWSPYAVSTKFAFALVDDTGAATMALQGLPSAHKAAIAPFQVEVYGGAPGVSPELVGGGTVVDGGVADVYIPSVSGDWLYWVLIVDPVGRRSRATDVQLVGPGPAEPA